MSGPLELVSTMDTFGVRTQDKMHANEHKESLYAPAVAEFEWVTKQKPLANRWPWP
jgi:hypothetical protein